MATVKFTTTERIVWQTEGGRAQVLRHGPKDYEAKLDGRTCGFFQYSFQAEHELGVLLHQEAEALAVTLADEQADRDAEAEQTEQGEAETSPDAEGGSDLARGLDELRTILPLLGETKYRQAKMLSIVAGLLEGRITVEHLEAVEAAVEERLSAPPVVYEPRPEPAPIPAPLDLATLPPWDGFWSVMTSPNVPSGGVSRGDLTHAPTLRFDAHGNLWAGTHGDFENAYGEDGSYFGPRPVIEIAHLRSHGGLAVVITHDDVFVMTEAEYQEQV